MAPYSSSLHREVGEEEVVVDDDDVARGGLLVHAGDEAALELRALLAGAEFAAGIELGPGGAVFGELCGFRRGRRFGWSSPTRG